MTTKKAGDLSTIFIIGVQLNGMTVAVLSRVHGAFVIEV